MGGFCGEIVGGRGILLGMHFSQSKMHVYLIDDGFVCFNN